MFDSASRSGERAATVPADIHARRTPASAPGAHASRIDARALAVFEDRYGQGAFARLLEWLAQPCTTFAEIAARMHVTRERVRQWHRRYLPDAPSGRERQRLCLRHQRRRRLFRDELFRTFFRHARDAFGPGRVSPIVSGDGYRRRAVAIDHDTVALRDLATRHMTSLPDTFCYRGSAAYVFVRLADEDFLFLPASAIRTRRGRAHGLDESRYRNSFIAHTRDAVSQADAAGGAVPGPST